MIFQSFNLSQIVYKNFSKQAAPVSSAGCTLQRENQFSVDGLNGAYGDIVLSFSSSPLLPPPNDNFADRILLSGDLVSITSSNSFATKEPGEPDHAGVTGGASVWWSWTAPATGKVTMTTAGSSFDTLLGVYTGDSLDTLSKIAHNDDDGASDTRTSKLTFVASKGTTYQIVVDGYAGATGRIHLNISM